jgi:hypothetical protein
MQRSPMVSVLQPGSLQGWTTGIPPGYAAAWTDCLSEAGFPQQDPSTALLWNIRSEFPEGPRQFPQAIDRSYQRL